MGQAVTCVLLMLAIASAYGFGVYLFPSLLPTVITSVHISFGQVALVYACRQVGFILGSVFCGYIAIYIGYTALIRLSLALVVAGLFALSLSQRAAEVGIVLVVLNCAAATIWIPMVPLVAALLPEHRQAQALGFIGSGTNYGVLANGLLVGWVAPTSGWRAAVIFAACLSALLLAALAFALKPPAGSAPGFATRQDGLEPVRRGANAWAELLRRQYLILLAIAFLGGFGGIPCINYWSAWGRLGLGLSPHLVGLAWLFVGLLGIVGGVFFGWSADRLGVRITIVVSTGILAMSIGCVLVFPGGPGFLAASILLGLSFFPIYGLIPAYVAKSASSSMMPLICGFVEGGLGLGSVLGNLCAGWLRAASDGFGDLYVMAFCVFLTMPVCALFLAPLAPHRQEQKVPRVAL